MITEQVKRSRRLKYRVVQLVLIALSLGIVVAFVNNKRSERRGGPDISLTSDVPTVAQLGPGDARLFNVDTTVELILRGDKMLAGLSPKTVEKVRNEIRSSGNNAKSGSIGDVIASTVKEQVADKIGMHIEYDIRDIEQMWIENHQIRVEWKSGKEGTLFGQIKVDGNKESNNFDLEEAKRFIELVKARQQQITR